MANPLSELKPAYRDARCDKCGYTIYGGYDGWYFIVKSKHLRKRGLLCVCQRCGEGIIKELESEAANG